MFQCHLGFPSICFVIRISSASTTKTQETQVMPVTTLATSTPTPGELKLTNANTWYQLQSSPKFCTKVRLSAPTASSPNGAANSKSILVCESPTQPASTAGAWELPPTATGLNYVLVSDASLVWVCALNAGDALEFSIQ